MLQKIMLTLLKLDGHDLLCVFISPQAKDTTLNSKFRALLLEYPSPKPLLTVPAAQAVTLSPQTWLSSKINLLTDKKKFPKVILEIKIPYLQAITTTLPVAGRYDDACFTVRETEAHISMIWQSESL